MQHFKKISFIALLGVISLPVFAEDTTVTTAQTSSSSSDFNRFNLYVDPVGFVAAEGGIGADFRLFDRLTIGPEFGLLVPLKYKDDTTQRDFDISAYFLGIKANIQLTGSALTESGWYVAPEVGFLRVTVKDKTDDSKVNVSSTIVGGVAGYRWIWDCGLNFGLGAGARYISFPKTVTYKAGPSDGVTVDTNKVPNFIPALELNLGWAF